MILWTLILFLLLAAAEQLYIRIIPDIMPGLLSSSHTYEGRRSITGGGIIFFPATLACYFTDVPVNELVPVFIGGAVLWIVSFYDDARNLSPMLRLCVQTVVTSWIMLFMLVTFGWPVYILSIIVGVAIINAYNFMDGVCGMLAIYATVTMCGIIYAMLNASSEMTFLVSLPMSLFVAAIVFGWVNVVQRDRVFCGDVGSIIVGYFTAFLLAILIAATGDAGYLVLVSVFLVDVAMTIGARLLNGENLLTTHHRHLYQKLTAQGDHTHLAVSVAYGLLQICIDAGFFMLPTSWHIGYLVATYLLLAAFYFILSKSNKLCCK